MAWIPIEQNSCFPHIFYAHKGHDQHLIEISDRKTNIGNGRISPVSGLVCPGLAEEGERNKKSRRRNAPPAYKHEVSKK